MRFSRFLPVFGFGFLLIVSPRLEGAILPSMQLGHNNGVNAHPHNLSKYNSNALGTHAAPDEEDEICIFCHTPHGASEVATPLWNREDPNPPGGFPLYGNDLEIKAIGAADYDVNSAAGYPNGSTRMCMSCHDGVTAIGTVLNGGLNNEIATSLASFNPNDMPAGSVVDLSTSHPVSFVYDATVLGILTAQAGHENFRWSPPAGSKVRLDSTSRVQCTTCHDPHVDTKGGGYNLPMWSNYSGVENADYSGTCNSCHGAGAYGGFPGDLGDGHTDNFLP